MVRLKASSFAKLAAALCLLVLGSNLYFLFALASTHQTARDNQNRLHLYGQAVTSAREAQIAFKNQIQEWKNLLLRGQNPEDFQHYHTAFTQNETLTQQRLDTLVQAHNAAGLGPLPDDLLAAHHQLGEIYRQGLARYNPNDPNSAFQVDRQVRGIDRKLNNDIDSLASITENHTETLIRQMENEANQSQRRHALTTKLVGGLTVLSVFAFAALAIFRQASP